MPYKNINNYTDNLPNKVIDALAFGLPILSTLSGELEELINNRGVGIHCSPLEKAAYFNACRTLLDDETAHKKLKQNCRNLYETEFQFDVTYKRLVQTIEDLWLESLAMKQADKQIEFERYESKAELFSSLCREQRRSHQWLSSQFAASIHFLPQRTPTYNKTGDRVLEIDRYWSIYRPFNKEGASVTATIFRQKRCRYFQKGSIILIISN